MCQSGKHLIWIDHPKVMLSSRYVTFHKSLISSSKLCVRLLARLCERDRRTVMGRTLDTLCNECGVADITNLSSNLVKKKMVYHRIPEEQQWRINLATELLQFRDLELSLPGFSMVKINDMLNFIFIY